MKSFTSRAAIAAACLAGSVTLGATGSPAQAQAAEDSANAPLDDIVVTARKRQETSIAVPVVLTAVSGAELERRAINNVDSLARLVPQLISGEGGGTVQGGNIALRGISGGDANPFADQAVSFNIDGVQVAKASVRRVSDMDIAQIEVLKGPQALFFGKNSPGGIVSIRSADPTDHFQAKASIGYELNAHQVVGEGYVSGPLTENLGARLAVYAADMRGWIRNDAPAGLISSPHDRWGPESRDIAARGTLKYDSDKFDARLKFNYAKSKNSGPQGTIQFVNCPLGTPANPELDNCRADDHSSKGDLGPNFATATPPGIRADGHPFGNTRQTLASFEMNYHFSDELTGTSVSGLYDMHHHSQDNYNVGYFPATILLAEPRLDIREYSQEVRLASDYKGPINFTIGAHYQRSKNGGGSKVWRNALAPAYINDFLLTQTGEAESVFGQVRWLVLPKLELTAGGRYSWEKKHLTRVIARPTGNAPYQAYATPFTKDNWTNFSPEVTANFRPTDALTIFGSYKRGFLSGGFNSSSSTPNGLLGDLRYGQQTIRGFEGGVKAALLDGKLRTNFALYKYNIRGLQVTYTVNGTNQVTSNAGETGIKGAEFDFNYRTPVDGLSVYGAAAYNKGRYKQYLVGCYKAETVAQGCDVIVSGTTPTVQNLAGEPIARAPEWVANIGFNFEQPVGSGFKLGISGGATYSDSYFTDAQNNPGGKSPSYTLLDGSVRFSADDDSWEVALIGRNLTDKYYWTRSTIQPIGTRPTVGDTSAAISRGREIMVRLSYKFGA